MDNFSERAMLRAEIARLREALAAWYEMPNEVKLFHFVHGCIKAYRHEEPPYDAREVEFIAWCLERWTRRRKAALSDTAREVDDE